MVHACFLTNKHVALWQIVAKLEFFKGTHLRVQTEKPSMHETGIKTVFFFQKIMCIQSVMNCETTCLYLYWQDNSAHAFVKPITCLPPSAVFTIIITMYIRYNWERA